MQGAMSINRCQLASIITDKKHLVKFIFLNLQEDLVLSGGVAS